MVLRSGPGADYAATGVLVAFGLFTIVRRNKKAEENVKRLADARGRAAVLRGVSVSLDELAIGFTLGLLQLLIVPVLVAITVQAFVVSQLGLRLGRRLSERFREAAETRRHGLARPRSRDLDSEAGQLMSAESLSAKGTCPSRPSSNETNGAR